MVLGGASIFGGTCTVHGTLLGVVVLAVLKIGLTLSDQPSELAGILTGVVLVVVLAGEAVVKWFTRRLPQAERSSRDCQGLDRRPDRAACTGRPVEVERVPSVWVINLEVVGFVVLLI